MVCTESELCDEEAGMCSREQMKLCQILEDKGLEEVEEV
jgi:hypothetical protein